GWILSWECIMVSTETISPELTVSFGDSLGSSHPHCVVSRVAASRWRFGPACAGLASPALRTLVSSPTASNKRRLNRPTTVFFAASENFIANSFPNRIRRLSFRPHGSSYSKTFLQRNANVHFFVFLMNHRRWKSH